MTNSEIGQIMGINESSIRSLADARQISAPVEEDASPGGEVMLAMDTLANRISVALMAVDNLKARLHPILPPESKNEGTNYIHKPEFSCPLAKELEHDYCGISKIIEVIQYLLKNIEL